MNLTAYDENGIPLFARRCQNKREARKHIVFNPWAFRVDYVIYKHKEYKMKEVYKW